MVFYDFLEKKAGLSTPLFSVRYVTFFSVLKKERSVLFRSFLEIWRLMSPQKNVVLRLGWLVVN